MSINITLPADVEEPLFSNLEFLIVIVPVPPLIYIALPSSVTFAIDNEEIVTDVLLFTNAYSKPFFTSLLSNVNTLLPGTNPLVLLK